MAHPSYRVSVVPDVQVAAPGGAPLCADLYLPQGVGTPLPVIVWLHGGGWRFGGRRAGPDLSRFFAASRFAMVAVEYRLSTVATFPAQIEDVKSALAWIERVSSRYGLDPDAIGLWGVSAGGHLAALAALAPDDRFNPSEAASTSPVKVRAVVCGYAPLDFLQLDAHRAPDGAHSEDPETLRLPPGMRSANADSFESLLLGAPIESCPDRVREANPLTYVHPGAPPFLILHGLSDTTIAPHQSELLYRALAAAGNDVTLALIDKLGHGFLDRSHLDDAPPRRMTIRTHAAGAPERTECVVQPIFPVLERFFDRRLRGRG
jgi:acetyl esterase/lipase